MLPLGSGRRGRVGSIQPQPLNNQADGSLLLSEIEDSIKPDDSHYARTRLLALENTIGGKVLSQEYMEAATALARRHGLATHLDGARIFNAATALNTPVATLTRSFDTVSVCLSKGLGAPVGSVLVGSEQLIAKARRTRKMVGGGLRQVGILAAAGLYALEHNVARLADDHANATTLAKGLAAYGQLKVTMPDTNIVFVEVDSTIAADFKAHLAARGLESRQRIARRNSAGSRIWTWIARRWKTHWLRSGRFSPNGNRRVRVQSSLMKSMNAQRRGHMRAALVVQKRP